MTPQIDKDLQRLVLKYADVEAELLAWARRGSEEADREIYDAEAMKETAEKVDAKSAELATVAAEIIGTLRAAGYGKSKTT